MNIHAQEFPDAKVVPLAQLKFGDDHPLGSVNVRKTRATEEEDAQLRASIAADGILQSLLVTTCEGDDHLYVIAGNRRLKCARDCPNITEAPAIVRHNLSVDEALSLGLAEDLPKVPPHAVDRYEAFAKIIVEEELKPADVAARFGIAEITVKRALALGRIPAKIRAAWRSGDIDAGIAQLFTRAKDDKQAEKVYDRLKKQGALHAHTVKTALCPHQGDALLHVNFIGLDAYRAAGGDITVDLFDDEHVVRNPELAAELARKKLLDKCQSLTFDDGWGWAEIIDAMPADWRSWREIVVQPQFSAAEQKRLDELEKQVDVYPIGDEYDRACEEANAIERTARLRELTAEDRARSGCVVELLEDGRVHVDYGILKPAPKAEKKEKNRKDAKAQSESSSPARSAEEVDRGDSRETEGAVPRSAARAPSTAARSPSPAKTAEELPELSQSHRVQLGMALTEAAAIALRQQPGIAQLIVLAGVAASYCGSFNPAIRASVAGLAAPALEFSETDIAANIARWEALPRDKLDLVLANVAAASVAFNHFGNHAHALADPDIAAVCNLIDAALLRDALKKCFDAEDYFKKAPKAFALAAIADVCGADVARSYEKKAKGDIVKFALANISGTAWLPEALRTARYDGPGAPSDRGPPSPHARSEARGPGGKGRKGKRA